jgi:CBS domain-containing protein
VLVEQRKRVGHNAGSDKEQAMNLLKIGKEAVVIDSSATVMDALKVMSKSKVGAILIIDDGQLNGIFTERDLMMRVILKDKRPESIPVTDVMTAPVLTITKDKEPDDVLKLMQEKHIRHLPLVNGEGNVEGMISIRHLLTEKVEYLTQELDSLEAYISADGIGG